VQPDLRGGAASAASRCSELRARDKEETSGRQPVCGHAGLTTRPPLARLRHVCRRARAQRQCALRSGLARANGASGGSAAALRPTGLCAGRASRAVGSPPASGVAALSAGRAPGGQRPRRAARSLHTAHLPGAAASSGHRHAGAPPLPLPSVRRRPHRSPRRRWHGAAALACASHAHPAHAAAAPARLSLRLVAVGAPRMLACKRPTQPGIGAASASCFTRARRGGTAPRHTAPVGQLRSRRAGRRQSAEIAGRGAGQERGPG
jgi:hypothetical protein